MRNVAGLPACPDGMSEPHYLSLIFSKSCSMCEKGTEDPMDMLLLVRLCGSCLNANLISLNTVPLMLTPPIPYSRERRVSRPFVLHKDYKEIMNQYEGVRMSDDRAVMETWVNERSQEMKRRWKQYRRLSRFFAAQERSRERELEDAKMARELEIKRRLLEMGWTKKDMKFPGWCSEQFTWKDLVFQPKPLTNQAWAKIQPRLVPLLEVNRERRLEWERDVRKRAR
ncbi:hypothetical protein B0J17DRAFT_140758 [Rhizoctonia solani]|nr:hypothetical protein B0J17DRAFT_140758 [Rhizoctonia solani]